MGQRYLLATPRAGYEGLPRADVRPFQIAIENMMKSLFRGVSVSVVALCAAGCATPNPTPLDRPGDVPTAFSAPVADPNAPIWPSADWWVNFRADELPALEATAQRENLDIAAANARILQAEAQDSVAFAGLLPSLNGNLGASRSGSERTGVTGNNFSAGLSGSYTL